MCLLLDLLKVLYMNAQYLILHVCHAKTEGALDSQFGVDCDGVADVNVYGRTAVITGTVHRMLADIAEPRSCVDLTRLQMVKQNGQWQTPSETGKRTDERTDIRRESNLVHGN